MKHRRWLTWLVFAVCALAVIEGLGWVTLQSVRLERRERQARAEAQLQELVRLALWRMESEVTPILAQEAARPYFHYLPFYPAERAYTRMWQAVQPGEVLVPSPLLEGGSPYARLYYEVGADGSVSSPQAPGGAMRELAEGQYVEPEFLLLATRRLEELRAIIRPPEPAAGRQLAAGLREGGFEQRVETQVLEQRNDRDAHAGYASAETAAAGPPVPAARPAAPSAPPAPQQTPAPGEGYLEKSSKTLSEGEYVARQQAAQTANTVPEQQSRSRKVSAGPGVQEIDSALSLKNEGDLDAARMGRAAGAADERNTVVPSEEFGQTGFVARWVRVPEGSTELLLERRLTMPAGMAVQGLWIDWPELRARLMSVTRDLLPRATLAPVESVQNAPSALLLASIPVMLEPGEVPALSAGVSDFAHGTLLLTWAAVLAGIGAIGVVLRKSMELSDRRGRFVSAVTHELRTPLTTFCLYTEMLESGMVPEDSRRGYLRTLHEQSRRLAGIVENVLDYARLGGWKPSVHAEAVASDAILERVMPALEGCASRCGMELIVENAAPDAMARADVATVERILMNLVDNACKYAGGARDKRIHLTVQERRDGGSDGRVSRRGAEWVEFCVRDHGPGVARADRAKVFQAFRRGRGAADGAKSGLGLGLALSRGLARQLGGDLRLGRSAPGAGAEFCLRLARADRSTTPN